MIAPPWAPVPPDGYGGIEAVLDRLVVGIRRAGHDVLLFCTGDATAPVERDYTLEQARTHSIGADAPELRHVIAGYEATADCDIVHDHTLIGPVWAAGLPRRPVVTTAQGAFDDDTRPIYRHLAATTAIICISHLQRPSVPDLPVAAIHHGFDVEDIPLGDSAGGYGLFLGRMAPEKGARFAIEAATRAGLTLRLAAKLAGPGRTRALRRLRAPAPGSGLRVRRRASRRGNDLKSLSLDLCHELDRLVECTRQAEAERIRSPKRKLSAWRDGLFQGLQVTAIASSTPPCSRPSGRGGESSPTGAALTCSD